eukprot:scaffold23403_cov31-Tisochrysis_lutea.AAC.1
MARSFYFPPPRGPLLRCLEEGALSTLSSALWNSLDACGSNRRLGAPSFRRPFAWCGFIAGRRLSPSLNLFRGIDEVADGIWEWPDRP